MKQKEQDQGETSHSLLRKGHKNQTPDTQNNKKGRCICICLIVFLIAILLIGIIGFISLSKYTISLRCKISETFDLDLVECATADTLASLSAASNITHIHLNITSGHGASGSNYSVCDQELQDSGNISIECAELREKQKQEYEWRVLAERSWNIAYEVLHDKEDWKLDKGTSLKTGRVYSKTYEGIGRVSRLEVHFEGTIQQMRDLLIDGFPNLAEWNPTMGKVKLLEKVGDDIQIVHMQMNSFVEGLMSGRYDRFMYRDFVSIRYWKTVNNETLVMQTATEHPDAPPSDDYVRGFHKPGGMMFGPVKNKPNKVLFQWSMAADMGMWMPQWLVDRTKAMAMFEFVANMKEKLKELNKQ